MAPTFLERAIRPSRQFPCGADGKGGIKGKSKSKSKSKSKKAADGCLFGLLGSEPFAQ